MGEVGLVSLWRYFQDFSWLSVTHKHSPQLPIQVVPNPLKCLLLFQSVIIHPKDWEKQKDERNMVDWWVCGDTFSVWVGTRYSRLRPERPSQVVPTPFKCLLVFHSSQIHPNHCRKQVNQWESLTWWVCGDIYHSGAEPGASRTQVEHASHSCWWHPQDIAPGQK